ncbi:cse1l, partial [Symbiodinium sp. KB8]
MQEVASAPADAKALTPRFQALATCCRIFYCLNYIELPEFFLENMQTWVAMFLHFLSYSNAALEDPDELMVPGPVETLQTEIMACMALYAEKFDDDFEEHIPKFVDATWKLLQAASAGSVASVPKYDGLVTQAIRFLSSVVSKSSQAQLFANPATLQAMCQSAVLPNMALREADEIAFEENPKEYIMRDIEGSSSETRRAAASKMIKGLLVSFSQ